MSSIPTMRRANITTGTHGALTLYSLGMGAVYRPDEDGGVTRPLVVAPDDAPLGLAPLPGGSLVLTRAARSLAMGGG